MGESDITAKSRPQRHLNTYNELFVPQGHREVSVEGDPEVFGIETFVHYDVFQECSLMTEDFRQPATSDK